MADESTYLLKLGDCIVALAGKKDNGSSLNVSLPAIWKIVPDEAFSHREGPLPREP